MMSKRYRDSIGTGEHREQVILTDEAYRMVESFTRAGFKVRGGTQQPDGSWAVPLSQDVIDRLKDWVWEGETLSETIIRVCRAVAGGGGLRKH